MTRRIGRAGASPWALVDALAAVLADEADKRTIVGLFGGAFPLVGDIITTVEELQASTSQTDMYTIAPLRTWRSVATVCRRRCVRAPPLTRSPADADVRAMGRPAALSGERGVEARGARL